MSTFDQEWFSGETFDECFRDHKQASQGVPV